MASTPSLTGIHDIDIFYQPQVLSHLLPDPKAPTIGSVESSESRSARKALACLARTHSSFTQPALAEMWRSLPSQKPLEHLLRVVGIAQRPPPAAGQWYTPPLQMCGTPITHKSGWIQFQEYASLVREIIIDPVDYSRWDVDSKLLEDTIWCRLFAAFGDMPVLPCLEGATLRSTNSLRSIDTGVLRLVNPFIREFIVTFPHTSKTDLKPLGAAITVCFSSIQNLEVFSMEVQDVTPFLDMETLPRLHPRLRSLKLHRGAPIKLSCLRPLTTLLNLEYLSIKLFPWDSELPSLPTMVFPRLRSLQVSCGGFAIVGMLLNHIEVPQLQSFFLRETHENSNDMAQEFSSHLRTLVTKCPFLTAFEWHSDQARIRRVGYLGKRLSSATLAEILTPLLSHRAMQRFSATFWGPVVPYNATDFRTIAEAWPDLESFVLSDDMHGDRTWAERYADLESVVALARHCPGLRSLHFPTVQFDSSSALVSELMHGTPAPHWLHELYVDHVTRPDPEERDGARSPEDKAQFRALMEKLFPNATIPRLG